MSPTPLFLMASGRRDRLIELVPVTDSTDTSSFPIEPEGTPTIELWAGKEDAGGRERIAMNQESAPYDTRWFLPWSDAYDPDTVDVPKTFKLRYGGRDLDITWAGEIGRREGVEILTLGRQG